MFQADTQKEYKNVTDAYQTLKDESLRAAYDSEQEKAVSAHSQGSERLVNSISVSKALL